MQNLLMYFFLNILLSNFSLAQLPQESNTLSLTIPVFILILIMLFLFYKMFTVYRSKNKKTQHLDDYDAQNNDAMYALDRDEDLLNESKDLIHFLKVNTQTMEVNNSIYRVQNLLNEVYGLLEPLVQKNAIEFIYDIDSSVPIELVGDTLLLEQALYNLLSHTLKNEQHSTVTVVFKKVDSPEPQLHIEVYSSHISNDMDNIEKESNLRTAQKLIQHMHGTLYTKQTQEKGTIYKITLPLLQNSLYIETYHTLPEILKGKNVLLIEDNPYTATAIGNIFEHFGLHMHVKGTQALPTIQNFDTYDILMLDANLLTPILMRHLEELKINNDLKVISIEILYGERDRRFKPNKLIDKYLYKPLSKGMIFGLLYETYVMQPNTNTVEVTNTLTKSGEIVFIEEEVNITRESFQDFNTLHILVVEDNKINQKIIQSVLEKSHIRISIANNGLEALTLLEKEKDIEIVLMDINMPIMDGYQATKKIRENDIFSTLPIIVVSGLGFRNEIEEMYLAGADAHLTKPFKIGQLYAAFKMFLSQSKTAAVSAQQTIPYKEDKNILDVDQGVNAMQNILSYRDVLRETLVGLKYTDELVKEHIIKQEFSMLREYCMRTLQESNYIGATNLSHILNEMIILINNNEEPLLQTYISLYREVWLKTRRHIELYLKSVDAY